ncbi:MAG TPA: toll/interleukin-1 receptor domain-containing protein [Pyrinomonadaceae bacterium]|nr:toll/interleukin-1 receptor domain-containing protein [Pyrinomonadaceae bacterium]
MSINEPRAPELIASRAKAEAVVNYALDWIAAHGDEFAYPFVQRIIKATRDLTLAMQGRSISTINEKISALLKVQQLMLGSEGPADHETHASSQILDPDLYRLHQKWRADDSFAAKTHPRRTKSRREGAVFVSYAREDRLWLDRLCKHLRPLVRNGKIEMWHDQMIAPGRNWVEEIEGALNVSSVAILLLSSAFVASDFIHTHELPRIAKGASQEGVVILPLVVGHCLIDEIQYINDIQLFNDPEQPLSRLDESSVEKTLVDLAKTVRNLQREEKRGTNI